MKNISRKLKSSIRSLGYDLVRHIDLSELLHIQKIDVVLDIGANDGGYASELRESGWRGPIVSFEPQPRAFSRLKARFANDQQWTGHPIGLGSENSTMTMNIHEMDVLSSFLEKIENSENSEKAKVEVKRMDSILDQVLGQHSKPFVKIDTQGFELEVIRGFGSKVGLVTGWQLELSIEPLYQNQPKIEEVISIMRNHGFSIWRLLPGLRDPKTLRSFEFDGIFFKNE